MLIVFDEDDTQRYHLNGKSTKETDEWMEKIRNARYRSLRVCILHWILTLSTATVQ